MMKIKLAILDSDQGYISRVVSAFQSKYADKVEVYAFTDESKALAAIKASKINVLFAADSFKSVSESVPSNCGFAYLVETRDIEQYAGQRAVCKFQKVEQLYNAIADLFADSAADEVIVGGGRSAAMPLYVFASASGGVGTSTVAVAVAKSLVAFGRTPLYINFENFGSSDLYFSGDGQTNFGDVIYAIKSRKPNLAFKLEATAKRDVSGVYYYASNTNALDTEELSNEEINSLIRSLKQTGFCDCMVIDVNLSVGDRILALFKLASKIVFVSDGTDVSNTKLTRAYDALQILESSRGVDAVGKAALFFNKFSNKTGKRPEIAALPDIGGTTKFEHMTTDQIIRKMLAEHTATPIIRYLTESEKI
ncbi:MAG: chromosome partitioning protein ParA [Clostridiales Family XIII bacterium]|jgi:cellulose biosynthesis protein BcsQ|nr:chromosome partitioning protein ParA [Clostridiales Family XIII bacterium]